MMNKLALGSFVLCSSLWLTGCYSQPQLTSDPVEEPVMTDVQSDKKPTQPEQKKPEKKERRFRIFRHR